MEKAHYCYVYHNEAKYCWTTTTTAGTSDRILVATQYMQSVDATRMMNDYRAFYLEWLIFIILLLIIIIALKHWKTIQMAALSGLTIKHSCLGILLIFMSFNIVDNKIIQKLILILIKY